MNAAQAEAELARAVAGYEWYHSLELAPGVVTPGFFDHRPLLSKLPIPDSLADQRCLDIGTFDGFWAFDMERRGGNVTAIDINDPLAWDWPTRADQEVIDAMERRKKAGVGFEIAARALDSNVEKVDASVYDLDPTIHGEFDYVFMGSMILHLRDPVRALERIRSVCRGQFLSIDAVDPLLSVLHPRRPIGLFEGKSRPWWWKPNLRGYRQMIHSAGFDIAEGPTPFLIPPGAELRRQPVPLKSLRSYDGRQDMLRRHVGDPHAFILARPGLRDA